MRRNIRLVGLSNREEILYFCAFKSWKNKVGRKFCDKFYLNSLVFSCKYELSSNEVIVQVQYSTEIEKIKLDLSDPPLGWTLHSLLSC